MKIREKQGKEAKKYEETKNRSQTARQQYRKLKKMVPRAAGLKIRGLIPGAVTSCSHLQNVETGTGAPKAAFAIGELGYSRGQSDQGFNLTTCHYLVPRWSCTCAPLISLRCRKKETSTHHTTTVASTRLSVMQQEWHMVRCL